jgi:hypothetical protein
MNSTAGACVTALSLEVVHVGVAPRLRGIAKGLRYAEAEHWRGRKPLSVNLQVLPTTVDSLQAAD